MMGAREHFKNLYGHTYNVQFDSVEVIRFAESYAKTRNETPPVSEERAVAISALKKIADPIQYLQEEAKKEGAVLNGYMAGQLTKDANYYQEIARKALKQLTNPE
jgi:hypothetical protein